jgi:hypothetical protein
MDIAICGNNTDVAIVSAQELQIVRKKLGDFNLATSEIHMEILTDKRAIDDVDKMIPKRYELAECNKEIASSYEGLAANVYSTRKIVDNAIEQQTDTLRVVESTVSLIKWLIDSLKNNLSSGVNINKEPIKRRLQDINDMFNKEISDQERIYNKFKDTNDAGEMFTQNIKRSLPNQDDIEKLMAPCDFSDIEKTVLEYAKERDVAIEEATKRLDEINTVRLNIAITKQKIEDYTTILRGLKFFYERTDADILEAEGNIKADNFSIQLSAF